MDETTLIEIKSSIAALKKQLSDPTTTDDLFLQKFAKNGEEIDWELLKQYKEDTGNYERVLAEINALEKLIN